MGKMLQIIFLIVASLSAGCASLSTSSDNPEITLSNVKFDCVRSLLMNGFINQGYTVRNVSDSQIVAGRKSNTAPFMYYTFYGGAPEERVTIHFFPLDTPDALRVVSTAAYVSNPATASETVHAVEGTQEDQDHLLSMLSTIENRCRKSP